MKKIFTAGIILAFFVSATAQHSLEKKWETDTLLKVPESVLYDANGKVLYVTNIDGEPWGRDSKGSVGKVGLDGKIIAVDWVSGLNAPKGMGLEQDKLYVADLDNVTVISTRSGSVIQKIYIPGAEGLNDISIDKNGIIYVTDSRAKRVYRIENNMPSLYLSDLKGPNGILAHGDDLYVLDNGGLYKVAAGKSLTKITDGMEGGTDGVENIKGSDFIVSCWAGSIWYVHEDGSKEHLLDTREQKMNTADIGYDAKNRIVYVPTFFKNTVIAYELK